MRQNGCICRSANLNTVEMRATRRITWNDKTERTQGNEKMRTTQRITWNEETERTQGNEKRQNRKQKWEKERPGLYNFPWIRDQEQYVERVKVVRDLVRLWRPLNYRIFDPCHSESYNQPMWKGSEPIHINKIAWLQTFLIPGTCDIWTHTPNTARRRENTEEHTTFTRRREPHA